MAGGAFAQNYSYGYFVGGNLPDGSPYMANYEGGNVDLRVPYIGYAAESITYKAAGIDAYNALTAHIEKRMTHGVQIAASYTYSHALDEQSGLGLFYNGNNPLNLRGGYGSADFDRTHVINFNYVYKLPDFYAKDTIAGKVTNGWSLVGLTVLQRWPAVQRYRLLGCCRQRLLQHLERHYQPDRSACSGMHGEECVDGALRCVLRGERTNGVEPGVLHAAHFLRLVR